MNKPVTVPVSSARYRSFSVRLPQHVIDELSNFCIKRSKVRSKVVRSFIISGLRNLELSK